jgi:hypothetical protein
MYIPKEVYQSKRHILSIASGILAGFLPSKPSNIHPYLLGAIAAILFTKLFFGDYDAGYQWTPSDILFAMINGLEGILGAWIAQKSLPPLG